MIMYRSEEIVKGYGVGVDVEPYRDVLNNQTDREGEGTPY